MYKLPKIVVVFLLLFFVSCGREEQQQTVPFAPVNFRIDLNGLDHALRNPLTYKTFTQRRLETDQMGWGGLLIVSCPVNENRLFAFDLACPCEGRRDVTVVPNNNGEAICPSCNSLFITSFGLGTVRSGTARAPLQRYSVHQQSAGVFLVRNN